MRFTWTATALGSLIAMAAPAAASAGANSGGTEDLTPAEEAPSRPRAEEELTRIIPGTLGASVGRATVVASSFGGYDSAAKAPVATLYTEVKIVPRLVLLAGAGWSVPNALGQGGGDMRPQLGARFQMLSQARSGMDMAVAFMFREDRFGAEDGLFQGSLSVGHRFDRVSAVANVVYGQDGEGDDHEGEVHLAVLADVAQHFHVGLDSRATRALASTDPRRALLGTPTGSLIAGPIAAFTYGPIAVMTEVGASEVWVATLKSGVVAMGGVGAAF
jgi:hypothetical protein